MREGDLLAYYRSLVVRQGTVIRKFLGQFHLNEPNLAIPQVHEEEAVWQTN